MEKTTENNKTSKGCMVGEAHNACGGGTSAFNQGLVVAAAGSVQQ